MSTLSHKKDEIGALDEAFKELRTAYEKYFAGVERLEPHKARDDFKKGLRRIMGEHNKNTARRFKLQTMQASLVTHEQYWNRITRQIEEGTYKRDRMRAAKLVAPPASEPEAVQQPAPVVDPVQVLHDAFMGARRKLGDHSPVPLEAFAKTVANQSAAIKSKYQCKDVEFRVAEKDGRVILKAVPR